MWIWISFAASRLQIGRSPVLLYIVSLLLMEWYFYYASDACFGFVADSLNRRTAKSSQSLVLFNVPLTTSRRQLTRSQHTLPLFIKSDCVKYTKVALIEIIYIEMLIKYQNKYRSWVELNSKSCWKNDWGKTIPESTVARSCLKAIRKWCIDLTLTVVKTNKRTVQGHSDTA